MVLGGGVRSGDGRGCVAGCLAAEADAGFGNACVTRVFLGGGFGRDAVLLEIGGFLGRGVCWGASKLMRV